MQALSLCVFLLSLCAIHSAPLSSSVRAVEEWISSMFRKDVHSTEMTLPKLAESLELKTTVEMITKAGLMETLSSTGPFTLMAPTDKAWEMLPKHRKHKTGTNHTALEAVMKYNVLMGTFPSTTMKNDELIPTMLGGDAMMRMNIYKDGKVVTASGRVITMTDKKASNGILHEVKRVPFPPTGTAPNGFSRCPLFKTMTMALKTTGLFETWAATGPFTIFAPTDEAFAKIPKETLDSLMKNKTALTEILNYHKVNGTYYMAGLTNGEELTTDCGKPLTVKMEGAEDSWTFMVNDNKVTYPDVTVTNGVVHVLSTVMMPPTARLRVVIYADKR